MGGFFLGIKVSTNPAYSLSAGMRDLHDDEGRVAVEAAEGHASGTGMLRSGVPLERLEVVNAVFWQASVGSLKNVVLVSARAGCEPRGGYACGAGSARKRLGFRS